jgi:transcriptional regulator PpsR
LLGDLDTSIVATVIGTAADVALIVDADGVVRDVAVGSDRIAAESLDDWIGRAWVDIVTTESRPKVEALRQEAGDRIASTWRQVNHRSPTGTDLPVTYAAVEVRPDGQIVALGRDLSEVAALQQRLVEAQQALEGDYARFRQAEMRYRLLFKVTSEAVLIVDAVTLAIIEANAAAAKLRRPDRPVSGQPLAALFEPEGARAVAALLSTVSSMGQGDDVRVRLADHARAVDVSAALFRQDRAAYYLVRLAPATDNGLRPASFGEASKLCPYVESAADGFVVTDPAGSILSANRAFLDLAQVPVEKQAIGRSLERWLGRAGVDLKILLNNLRERGAIRLFSTTVHGEHGGTANVEVSASSMLDTGRTMFVFSVRNVNQRLSRPIAAAKDIPHSIEQLSELIGVVPMKEIVRQSTDIIERLCIEAALKLTTDNRASAAELLGLSRQSLYVKLRRFGLAGDAS